LEIRPDLRVEIEKRVRASFASLISAFISATRWSIAASSASSTATPSSRRWTAFAASSKRTLSISIDTADPV